MCVVCVCLLHAERYFVVLNWHFSYIFHPLFASPTSPAWPEMKEKKEISYPVFLSRLALLPLGLSRYSRKGADMGFLTNKGRNVSFRFDRRRRGG